MKKIMILVLCLLLVLSLAACGGQDSPAETTAQTTQPQPEEQTQAPSETEPAPTEETVPEEEPAFDNSWASNDFEKLIPQPPFDEWTGNEMASNVYVLSCTGANEDDWGTYKQTLLDADFSLEDVDRGYKGFDAMGNYFEFMCTDNQALIVIESVEALGE